MVSTIQTKADYADVSVSTRTVRFDDVFRPGHAVKANFFWKGDVQITSVVDTNGVSLLDSGATRVARPTDGYIQIYGKPNVAGGENYGLTVTFASAVTNLNTLLEEVMGVDATTMFGATASGTATSGTSATTGTFTPSYSSGAIFVWGASDVAATCAELNIGGIQAVPSRFVPNSGFGAEQLAYKSSLGSNITAAMDFGGTVTKAVILAAELKAAAAEVYASDVVLGVGQGFFTFNGRRVFLLGRTYFDGLDWWLSDLVYHRNRRKNLVRICLDKPWADGGTGTESIFNSDGTIRPERAARVHALIRTASWLGMAVELIIHVADGTPNTASWITNATHRANAVTNAVAEFKSHQSICWDLANEFNYGTAYDNIVSELQPLIDAARTEDPDGLFFASGGSSLSGQTWGLSQADNSVITADVDAYLNTGLDLFAVHEPREVDFYDREDERAANLLSYIAGTKSRPDVPIYFNEPARRGSIFPPSTDPTGQQLKTMVVNAYLGGAAGIVEHSDASYNLRTATEVSQLDSEELIAADLTGPAIFPDGVRSSFTQFPKPHMRR